ncbi:GntR family transcriptional regulator [Ochrobactrum soli]|uniref:GntR family transcriptional regulator n=1 Tax=Ochrobactrum soli TaxID=2448455 RepID=A0A849KRE1_9HYPH|nr:GntR family transcriptional regulator [[Ochrobactrum] soli]NNU62833.1 GntR family transcriptional regulator [[Ochrobactrum] soli]
MAIERPQSLTNIVISRVRNMIIDGELELGSVLSERKLAEELNVSKTPVREAFAQLRSEGLVNIVPQSGVRVFTLSAKGVREICEFRKAIETAALIASLRNDPVALESSIRAVVEKMKGAQDSGDQVAYLGLDTDFHLAFFEHCSNQYLRGAYALYNGKIAALRTHLANKPQHTKLSFEEHRGMLVAINRRDVDELKLILDRHIGRTQETYEIGIEDIAAADAHVPRRFS